MVVKTVADETGVAMTQRSQIDRSDNVIKAIDECYQLFEWITTAVRSTSVPRTPGMNPRDTV